jgi:hypothetical protein
MSGGPIPFAFNISPVARGRSCARHSAVPSRVAVRQIGRATLEKSGNTAESSISTCTTSAHAVFNSFSL